MAPEPTTKTQRSGLSLYANLLDPNSAETSAPGIISRAPVVFKQTDGRVEGTDSDISVQRLQPNAASLRFQPTKRPQALNQKIKPKLALQKIEPQHAGGQGPKITAAEEMSTNFQQPVKTTISDWTAEPETEDQQGFYPPEKRQRGGRKKRKKFKDSQVAQNWDDIYDPSRPNSYEEYQNSNEKISEIREWKDRLYAHRYARKRTSTIDSDSDNDPGERDTRVKVPPGLSFAPLTEPDNDYPATGNTGDASIKEAYARHLKLTGITDDAASATVEESVQGVTPGDVTPMYLSTSDSLASIGRTAQSVVPNISKAPVRYSFPPAPQEIPQTEAELVHAFQEEDAGVDDLKNGAPRSSRPGQKGFAERLMSKYGWTKGSGLGASGTGIVNPLRVQLEKQKKKPDSEGGGYSGPGGRGKIIGGKKVGASTSAEAGRFGVMSEVIVLGGMLNGLDLNAEMERAQDGGLLQEIGDECSEKYGRVERVYIDRHESINHRVFVKFTSQLSALRAVNALQGRIFNGNIITAMFYDAEKFDSGIFTWE